MVYPGAIGREFLSRCAPTRILLVVENVVGAEFLEGLSFGVGARGRDDSGAGCFCELSRCVSMLLTREACRLNVLTCKAKMLTPPVP